MGVETLYFDPRIGANIIDLVTDKTSLIILESPGSLTFEVQDIPAIAKVAKERAKQLGNASSPDDAYQILRGFRSVLPRFRQQEATALALAEWLMTRDEVQQVLHPAVTDHPDHDLWKRDFTGGGCLFSVVLQPLSETDVLKFIDALEIFGIGYSYGGFESLAIHCDPQLRRSCADKLAGPLVRFACGLEATEDLKSDIEQALAQVF